MFAQKKKLTVEECDIVETQYGNFLDIKVASERSTFKEYQPYEEEEGVDRFFHQRLAREKEYKAFWCVVKMVLLLSHGQASVERGFSVNKQVQAFACLQLFMASDSKS